MCEHTSFHANIDVGRDKDNLIVGSLRIKCKDCGVFMRFKEQGHLSPDGIEASFALEPNVVKSTRVVR